MRPTDSSRPCVWVFAAQVRFRLALVHPSTKIGHPLRLKYREIDKSLPYSTRANGAQMTRSAGHRILVRFDQPRTKIGGIPVRDREDGLFSTRLGSGCRLQQNLATCPDRRIDVISL